MSFNGTTSKKKRMDQDSGLDPAGIDGELDEKIREWLKWDKVGEMESACWHEVTT